MEETSVEELAQLFRDNMWKLHRLPESIILDRELQFTTEITKELNKILEIKTKLSIAFHLQTNGQTEGMNQELKQYLRLFIDHKQKDWLEWLVSVQFVINNKAHLTTKVSPFMANYGRELKMEVDLRRKGKMEKAMEFTKNK